ncbi:MAG: glutamate--tRNA ligase [Candidatus Nealsonbacteria bacterium]
MFSKKKDKIINIRVRLAPSPTGKLHIGTARTALFNYLFAKKNNGSFILRIEDTDLERSDPEFEKDITESLLWLGIKWDEGPDVGGKYKPYRQTERIESYAKYLEKLLKEKKAYYCFCSEEELKDMRQEQMSRGEAPRYNGKCRQLSEKEIKKNLAEGKPSVIRFKVIAKKIVFNDLIRGKVEFESSLMGDFIVAKSLTVPLYNFAVAVDDFDMEISHVIRGEDHISNTPRQILIQEALGFFQPKYAHLPLILGPDRSKMSKRHGAVSVSEYKKEGYLPETLINFMAFLGWNPGTEREIYNLSSLVKDFSLENIQKGGAVFNVKRLDYLNGFYVRQKSIEKLTESCIPYFVESGLIEEAEPKEKPSDLFKKEIIKNYIIKETGEIIDFNYIKKIVLLHQERLKKLSEIPAFSDFFFKDKLGYQKELLKWKETGEEEIIQNLDELEKIFSGINTEDFNKINLEEILLPLAEKKGDRGKLLWPLRAALSGKEASAGPFEIAEIMGKEKVLKRIKEAKELIK